MLGLFPALSRVQFALLGVAVFVGVFGSWLIFHDAKVVNKERARVEKVGEKTNAKAQAKRQAAEQRPDLSGYYRD